MHVWTISRVWIHDNKKALGSFKTFPIKNKCALAIENSYIVELKRLYTHWELDAFLPEALKNCLVGGLRSETTKKKFLSEANLDFEKAVQIAYATETAEKDSLTFLSSETSVHIVEDTKSLKKSENRQKFQRKHAEECFRYGNNQYPSECRFKESKCFKCQKVSN